MGRDAQGQGLVLVRGAGAWCTHMDGLGYLQGRIRVEAGRDSSQDSEVLSAGITIKMAATEGKKG